MNGLILKRVIIRNKCCRFSFINRKIDRNNYEILGVPYDSDISHIRKQYIKLAKKYHPDLNKEKGSDEKFKEIQKAYEIIGYPNNRVEYDIQNNFSNDQSKYMKNDGRSSSRFNHGPRTIKNFYFNKWNDYKTPSWVNLKSGQDIKSEYIFRKDYNDNIFEESYKSSRIKRLIIKYRLLLYLLFIFSLDIFILVDNRGLINIYNMYKQVYIDQGKL